MVTVQDFWDRRADRYDSQVGSRYGRTYRETAAMTLRYLRPGDNVLEFACGTGLVTVQVAPHVARLRAIDVSGEMVRRARARTQGLSNVEASRMDLSDPSLAEGSFDAVLAFNVLCYLEDLPASLARIRALLKPGGLFLAATDCLGSRPTMEGLRKSWRIRAGTIPYEAFFTRRGLERRVAAGGFAILERKNLFPAPPNLFLAARAEPWTGGSGVVLRPHHLLKKAGENFGAKLRFASGKRTKKRRPLPCEWAATNVIKVRT